ncbi:MAG: TadE/TadG family type IV pilus assembly protein [Pseudomonadota bacterium]|jgi:Flp pilus assembly protein TadG
MLPKNSKKRAETRGFLSRLASDTRGNTLAIMGAAMIPLAGLVGGGIDISRMYITKTRLQHACDAGALAGRKAMGGGTWAQSGGMPNTVALQFFDANFQTTAYGSGAVARSFSETAGKVSGTASASLPMTLMRVFGKTAETLAVTCDAEMRLPNTDVMFVLDTTGSMDDKADPKDSDDKITSLKKAVKCFYEIVARLDTDAVCDGGAPSGGTGDQVQIRFGFVPYATNVNVGKLLPTAYFADDWTYQSRSFVSTTYTYPNPGTPSVTSSTYSWNSPGTWTSKQYSRTGSSVTDCQNNPPADTAPTSGTTGNAYSTTSSESNGVQTVTYKRDTPVSKYTYRYNSYSSKTCYYDRASVSGTRTDNYTRQDIGVPSTTWAYGPTSIPVSRLKNGTSWNDSFQVKIGSNGSDRTIFWDGCIEERETVRTTNYSPIPSGAKDLNIDLVPTPGDQSSLWAPALPSLIYMRQSTSSSGTNTGSWNTSAVNSTTDYTNNTSYFCPRPATKLKPWPVASDFSAYVDGLTPDGNTYHDIGLLWGARLTSPTGLFASENAFTPKGGEIERHIIFMTDGDTNAINTDYAAYGLPWFDRRQTSASSAPTNSLLNDQVNSRFAALCSAVKNKNITLWVISFGTGSNATTENRLKACATTDRYFVARDSATLQQTFRSIANQISQLRLTK